MAFNNAKFGVALKDMREQLGEKKCASTIREMLESGDITPEQCSIREIMEAVGTSEFGTITGEVINAAVMQEFKNQDLIGDLLCTTIPSKLAVDKVAGIDAVEEPEQVLEGAEYNDSSMGERYVTSRNEKFGRLLSITEEAVYFDQTNEIMNRARGIGRKAALHRERQIVYGVQDITYNGVDYRCYNPSAVQADFYSAANGNLVTNAPFGEAGMTDVQDAIHDQTDSEGSPIFINTRQAICLVPSDLVVQAFQLFTSIKVPEGMDNAANYFKDKATVLSSPFVSNQSETTYYFGNPKMAFNWLEVWPLQTFTQKLGSDDLFKKDLAARFKIRYFGSLAGVMPEYFYKATA